MKKYFFSGILLVFLSCAAKSQEELKNKYARTINRQDLKDDLTVLASDSLEGRETGTVGQKMAAAYIIKRFKKDGLEPVVDTQDGKSYTQRFELIKTGSSEALIEINNIRYVNGRDFIFLGEADFEQEERSSLVFAGEGNIEDYNTVSVAGKNVLIYCDCNRAERKEKVLLAKENKAKNVFIVKAGTDESFQNLLKPYLNKNATEKMTPDIPREAEDPFYFLISPSLGEDMLNMSRAKIMTKIGKAAAGNKKVLESVKSKKITFFAKRHWEIVETENILGLVEGSDKKDEIIVITAHYDHEGKEGDMIYNGADDDGSGTAAVLELAQAFALAKKQGHGPRRSILFITVTGEEKGLLGSEYYVNNPVLPLEQTIVNLNIDMIGRVDATHVENPDYVYLIGSDKLSTELHELSETANEQYTGLELDYTYNAADDPNKYYYRSDHYNFAKNGIPVIFYFNGTHDDYHKPTDTVDKINFEQLEKRTKLIFYTAWELAYREKPIALDESIRRSNENSAY